MLSGGPVVADYTRPRLRRIGSDLRNLRLKSGERVRIALRVLLEFGLDDHVLIGQRVWTRPRRHHHLLVLEGAPVLKEGRSKRIQNPVAQVHSLPKGTHNNSIFTRARNRKGIFFKFQFRTLIFTV